MFGSFKDFTKSKMRSMKLFQRFVLFYLVFSFIPMMIIGVIAYQKSVEVNRTNLINYSDEVASQVQKHISSRFLKLRNDAIDISFNEDIINFMDTYDQMVPSQMTRAKNGIMSLLANKFTFSAEVSEVMLISKEGNINYTYSNQKHKLYFYEQFTQELISRVDKEKLVLSTITNKDCYRLSELFDINEVGRELKMAENEAGIIFSMRIKHLRTGMDYGYLVLSLKPGLINEIYSSAYMDEGSDIYLINDNQKVIAASDRNMILNDRYPDKELFARLTEKKKKSPKNGVFSYDNEGYQDLISYQKADMADWYVINHISGKYLNQESRSISFMVLLVSLFSLGLAMIMLLIISNDILRPIRNIVKVINQVKSGNLNAKIHDKHNDELGVVADSFDEMTDEIQVLIEQVKVNEKRKRHLEFDMLQAKINPHFIANSLNTVGWLAKIQKADNISAIIQSLNHLLSQSLKDGNEMTTLKAEIEAIEHYLVIQRFRYAYDIKLVTQIPAEINELRIPKFTIQPLVENSVVHGHSNDNKDMTIIIKAVNLNDKVKISVIDDGKGMTTTKLTDLAKSSDETKRYFHGIGMNNVDQRLKLYFGQEYGLNISSVTNQFTIVEFYIPHQTHGEAENV